MRPEVPEESMDILTINAVEQIRRFICDDKSFFDSNFLEQVANTIFSKSIGSNELFRETIKQNIITFGALCIKYRKLEDKYSTESDLDIVDAGLIQTGIELSRDFLTKDLKYSSQLIYEKFRTIMSDSAKRIMLETDEDLNNKFRKYIDLKDTSVEDSEELQKFLESKLSVIDIIEQIETFSQFVSKKANTCNSITEFAKDFIETINNISTSLTTSTEINKDVMNMSDVISGEGFDTVISSSADKVKCGISVLDALMGGGFDKGRIYMFGGQTGGGKSTVLLNIIYGMLKQTNGVYFSEYDIYKKNTTSNSTIQIMSKFVQNHVNNHQKDKKKIFLYYTLENTKEETAKRIMCRVGLIPSTFWMLQQRDIALNKLFRTKGYNFTIDDLPTDMDIQLKQRIFNFAQMMNIVYNKNQLGSIEIIWHAPYSISSYDILLDCKRYERQGYQVEGIFVDYPDKMKATESTKSESDQPWLELGKIVDNLKALAAQVNVPILTVTQITRADNKATTAGKLGSSAGSIQKEYNSDTQINMNFNSYDDKMSKYFKEFTDQQRRSNIDKQTMFNSMLISNPSQMDSIKSSYDSIALNSSRSSDIIQMKIGIPTIQKIDSYITKNRDSVAKISFEMYIAYGMYLVTDFDNEVLNSARYAVETYMLIANYMIQKNYISPDAYKACVDNESDFIQYYNEQMRTRKNNEQMYSMAKNVNSPMLETASITEKFLKKKIEVRQKAAESKPQPVITTPKPVVEIPKMMKWK